jgi:hypothetical protein
MVPISGVSKLVCFTHTRSSFHRRQAANGFTSPQTRYSSLLVA